MSSKRVDRSFKSLLRYFFREYLSSQKGLSPNTIASYKETFKIFTPWIIKKTSINNPKIDDVSLLLLFEFLKHLEEDRGNCVHTRNARLAALKTFFRMCYFLLPDTKKIFDGVQFIQAKRTTRPLIDYFEHDEVVQILESIKKETPSGFRDFTILNLLYDTGMRASEIANLQLPNYQNENGTLEIIGKGNKWRQITVWARTRKLINKYINDVRNIPRPLYKDFMFINQKREALTRSGIYKLCQKYLCKVPDLKKRFTNSKRSPVHSWRHTAAVYMIRQGCSLLEVKVRLGHSSLESTLKYLNLDLTVKRERMKEFVCFINQSIGEECLAPIDWNSDKEVLEYLKNL